MTTKRWHQLGAVIGMMGIFGSACYPVRVSEACRQQMDGCLAKCDDPGRIDPAPTQDQKVDWGVNDARTQCVQLCHDLCT